MQERWDHWRARWDRWRGGARALVEHGGTPVSTAAFWGRVALLVILVLWTPSFVLADLKTGGVMNLWMHRVYLVFHEAGHVIFSPFGRFITVAGGTLLQLLMPGAVVVSFLRRGDVFGAAVGLWWLGGSVLDCAPYIYDARLGDLPLLGGFTGAERPETHDWMNLLRWSHLIMYDTLIARVWWVVGSLMMGAGLAWGGWVLRDQKACVID